MSGDERTADAGFLGGCCCLVILLLILSIVVGVGFAIGTALIG